MLYEKNIGRKEKWHDNCHRDFISTLLLVFMLLIKLSGKLIRVNTTIYFML